MRLSRSGRSGDGIMGHQTIAGMPPARLYKRDEAKHWMDALGNPVSAQRMPPPMIDRSLVAR